MSNMRKVIGLFSIVMALLAGAEARADVRTYTLDPTRSSLTFSGTIAGLPATPQTVGSDTTRYSGSLMADVTGTTIRFVDGGAMDATPQLAPQQPRAGGGGFTPAAVADYGFRADQPFGLDTARVALRDLVLDITQDANGPRVDVDSGFIDWRFEGVNMAGGRDGAATFNYNEAAPATISTVGGIETLTVPVSARLFFSTFDFDDTLFTANGQIVATRIVPEPGGACFFAGAVMALASRRSRFRARR